MVRGFLVRVLDFSQCENLKHGQENRWLLFSISPRVRVVRVVRFLDLASPDKGVEYALVDFLLVSVSSSCAGLGVYFLGIIDGSLACHSSYFFDIFSVLKNYQ